MAYFVLNCCSKRVVIYLSSNLSRTLGNLIFPLWDKSFFKCLVKDQYLTFLSHTTSRVNALCWTFLTVAKKASCKLAESDWNGRWPDKTDANDATTRLSILQNSANKLMAARRFSLKLLRTHLKMRIVKIRGLIVSVLRIVCVSSKVEQ